MMHPQFRFDLLRERSHQLELDIRRTRLLADRGESAPTVDQPVSLRLCCVHDDDALDRLAVLEGRPVPTGRFVLAEVNGRVVAALPLGGGEPLADPFQPTAHLLPLLRLRASQLEQRQSRRSVVAAKAIAARMLHPAR